jgi:hypothetical protein
LRVAQPDIEFVQFLDGDCTLADPGSRSPSAPSTAMRGAPVVIGHLQERRPMATVYNRLCALEWRSSPGDVTSFGALGGIMVVRASVFTAIERLQRRCDRRRGLGSSASASGRPDSR